MKEYGVSESWFKEITVKVGSSYAFPVKYVNNDKEEVLLGFMGEQTLYTYNLIKEKIMNVNRLLIYGHGRFKPLMHVPILLSLKDLIVGAEVHLITDASHKWTKWRRPDARRLGIEFLFDSDDVDSDDDIDHVDSDDDIDHVGDSDDVDSNDDIDHVDDTDDVDFDDNTDDVDSEHI